MTSVAFSRGRIWLKSSLKVLLCPLGLIFRPRGDGPLALMYHRVNSIPFEELGPVSRELTVPAKAFESQLNHLKREGYRTITVAQFADMLAGRAPVDRKAVLITFDDGYADNLREAAPILGAHGFGAVVLPMSDHLGKSNTEIWPLGDPGEHGRLMTAADLAAWLKAGFEVGSHTKTHPVLVHLGDSELLDELGGSKRDLESRLDAPVESLAYPGGEFDARVARMAARCGYRLCLTTKAGRSVVKDGPAAVRRVEVSASDSAFVFRIKVSGLLDWMGFRDSPRYRGLLRAVHRALVASAAPAGRGNRKL